MRSDNARCHHCAYLILSLPIVGECAGIKRVIYDSVIHRLEQTSDRRIATVKSHMRRYINGVHNIKGASDMKAVIDFYGEVKGCQESVNVQELCQTMKKHIMSGIQSVTYFSI